MMFNVKVKCTVLYHCQGHQILGPVHYDVYYQGQAVLFNVSSDSQWCLVSRALWMFIGKVKGT